MFSSANEIDLNKSEQKEATVLFSSNVPRTNDHVGRNAMIRLIATTMTIARKRYKIQQQNGQL